MLTDLGDIIREMGSILLTAEAAVVIAGAVLGAIAMYRLARAFGHGVPFALGLILFQPLFIMILGFGASAYQGKGAGAGHSEEREGGVHGTA